MKPGDFSPDARAAIFEAAGWRCVGCGASAPLTCQHRIARGMGGTSSARIGHPSNGVALDGSGTTGCHGWAESHPVHAQALGWRVNRHDDPGLVPFWTRYGWRQWQSDLTILTLTTEQETLNALAADALIAYCRDRMVTL